MTTAAGALGGVGIGATLLGSLTGMLGAQQTAAAQQQQFNYQAGVAQINQQIALQNADYARDQGEMQAEKTGLQAGQQMGQIKTSQASSGLDIRSGSALQVQQSQRTVTSMDLDTIRSNAAKTAYNYDVQAVQYGNQAQLYRMGGANAAAAGTINVATSFLGGVTGVSTKWLQGQSLGLWGGANTGQTATTGPGLGA